MVEVSRGFCFIWVVYVCSVFYFFSLLGKYARECQFPCVEWQQTIESVVIFNELSFCIYSLWKESLEFSDVWQMMIFVCPQHILNLYILLVLCLLSINSLESAYICNVFFKFLFVVIRFLAVLITRRNVEDCLKVLYRCCCCFQDSIYIFI